MGSWATSRSRCSVFDEGESFVFAGHLELVSSGPCGQGEAVQFEEPKSRLDGGRMSLSSELSNRLREAGIGWPPKEAMGTRLQRIAPLVQHQASRSKIPRKHELLVEAYQDKDGHHLFMYPFEGRKMHEALASLLAYRLARSATIVQLGMQRRRHRVVVGPAHRLGGREGRRPAFPFALDG